MHPHDASPRITTIGESERCGSNEQVMTRRTQQRREEPKKNGKLKEKREKRKKKIKEKRES